jgi:hypothetical protein
MSQQTSVRFRGDPELVEEVARLMEASDGAQVLSRKTERDSDTGVDFDLSLVMEVVGFVSALFFSGPIVPSLVKALRKKPGSKITIETPTRTVSIVSSTELSDDEVRRLIASLAT